MDLSFKKGRLMRCLDLAGQVAISSGSSVFGGGTQTKNIEKNSLCLELVSKAISRLFIPLQTPSVQVMAVEKFVQKP